MGIQKEERIGNSQVQWFRQFKYINTQLYISFNHWFICFFLQLLPISFLHTHFMFISGCTSQQMNFASLLVASWIFVLTEQIEPQVKPELKTALKNCGLHYLGMGWHVTLISAWRLVTISFWISGIHIWRISGCWKSNYAIVICWNFSDSRIHHPDGHHYSFGEHKSSFSDESHTVCLLCHWNFILQLPRENAKYSW